MEVLLRLMEAGKKVAFGLVVVVLAVELMINLSFVNQRFDVSKKILSNNS